MKPSKKVVLTEGDGEFTVSTPYNDEFIKDFKREVEACYRKWDKENKVWVIDMDCYYEVDELLGYHFPDIEIEVH